MRADQVPIVIGVFAIAILLYYAFQPPRFLVGRGAPSRRRQVRAWLCGCAIVIAIALLTGYGR